MKLSREDHAIIKPAYEKYLLKKSFFRYLGPVLLSVGFGQIAPLVDSLCISRSLGEEALSAMGIASLFYYVYNIIAALFGIGIGVSVAKETGLGEGEASGRIFTKGFLLMSILSVVLSAVVLCFREPVMLFLRATPENISFVREYMMVLMIGGVFYVWNIAGTFILTDDQDPKLAMAGAGTACIVNIIVDIIGLPVLGWGIWVAAFGTVFGMFCGCIVFQMHFRKNKSLARFDFSPAEPTDPSIFQLIRPGASQGILYGAIVIQKLIQNFILVSQGGTGGLGDAAVIENLELIILILIVGTSETVMPIAAAYTGERNRCGAHMVRRSAIVFGYLVLLPVFVILILFPNCFIRLFVEDNAYMLRTLPDAVRISMVAFLFSLFSQIQQRYYSSIGEEKTAMRAGIIQTVFQILALVIMPVLAPRNAVWLSLLVGTLAASVYFVVFHNGLKGVFRFFRGDTIYMTGAAPGKAGTMIGRDRGEATMDTVRQAGVPFCRTVPFERILTETQSILSAEERETLTDKLLTPFVKSLTSGIDVTVSLTILALEDGKKTAILHYNVKKGQKENTEGESEFCMMKRRMVTLNVI
ncbi:MAG: hypothetical protein IJV16_00860 [Lachnospiraceae bacterium]|nr:hypothetical protein [Lachnospiraceae bacterium]